MSLSSVTRGPKCHFQPNINGLTTTKCHFQPNIKGLVVLGINEKEPKATRSTWTIKLAGYRPGYPITSPSLQLGGKLGVWG